MFINVYRENPERDFEVVRAVAAAIIGQLDTLSPYILLLIGRLPSFLLRTIIDLAAVVLTLLNLSLNACST